MAPRTRHKCAQEYAIMSNSRGFAGLPTELLHQVASHIEGTTIPWHQHSLEDQRNKKRDVLRALCQLCRPLRTAFLPLVWQSLEAYSLAPALSDGKQRRYTARVKGVSKELLGQLRLVCNVKQPYASYVRIITVAIYSKDALTKLAHSMTLMPNLHTIHMMCRGMIGDDEYEKVFSGLVFPSLRRVIFPPQAILGFFPEVVEVLTGHPRCFHFSKFLDNVISHCPKVESIGWSELLLRPFDEQYHRNTRFVVEKLPNLRRVTFYMLSYQVGEIMKLLPLNLEKITLVCNADRAEVGQMVGAAQQVLAGSSLPNKCLELILGDERRMIAIPDKA